MYTKEEWQGAKKHHFEKPRCGVCGAPLSKARPRVATLTAEECHDPLCTACGTYFQTIRTHLQEQRRFQDDPTAVNFDLVVSS